jgi:16S rRNA (cytidine1402-2'-O)-methyltransferase
MLYLVPTPIGNLQDITFRAIEILKSVDLILAEDTRTSKKLMDAYQIDTSLRSFHAHNEHKILDKYIGMLQSGENLALISDAGTPGISDPGFLLVRACREAGIPIVSLPGPTAMIPALVASGIPCDRFHFEGFLPHKKGRQTRWQYLSLLPHTFCLYESPFRVLKCLREAKEHCGEDRMVAVIKEISKIHESCIRGPIIEVIKEFEKQEKIKGEFVLVFAGKE